MTGLTVRQSVTVLAPGANTAQRLPLVAPATVVLAAGASRALSAVCGVLNYVLAVVLICAGAGIEAAGRALMAEVRGSDG